MKSEYAERFRNLGLQIARYRKQKGLTLSLIHIYLLWRRIHFFYIMPSFIISWSRKTFSITVPFIRRSAGFLRRLSGPGSEISRGDFPSISLTAVSYTHLAVIPQLVPENALMRYNGINATMQSIVQFISPAAAGLILTSATLQRALAVDVFTAIVGISLLCFVAIPKQKMQKRERSVFDDMKTGIQYAFSDKTIGTLLIIYGIFILLCVPAGFMLSLIHISSDNMQNV